MLCCARTDSSNVVDAPSLDIVTMFRCKYKPALFHGGTRNSFSDSELTTQPDSRSPQPPTESCMDVPESVSASLIRMVLSYEPDTMRIPSGENATEWIGPKWPSMHPRDKLYCTKSLNTVCFIPDIKSDRGYTTRIH